MRGRLSLLPLAVALAIALALRLWGIGFGLPLTSAHPDELRVNGEGVSILGGNFRPSFFNYPSLFMYALGAVDAVYCAAGVLAGAHASLGACAASWQSQWEPFFLAARLLSAVAGTVTVLLVYLLGGRLFDRPTALASAAFLSVAFLHVRDSHFGVTDVAMTMLVILALVMLAGAHDRGGESAGDVRAFAAAGLVAGLAASTKYNAVLLVVPAFVSLGLLSTTEARRDGRVARALRRGGAWSGAMAAGFFAGTPYALLEPARFWQDASSEAVHLQSVHAIDLGIGWQYHLAVSLWHGLTWPLLFCAVAGAVWMIARAPRRAALLLAFPLVYYLIAGRGYTVFARHMIPVVPFLCITAGYFAASLASSIRATWRQADAALVCGAIVIVFGAPSAVKAWQLDRLLRRTDNRVLVADWIMERAAAQASIFVTGSGHGRPDIGRRHLGPELSFVALAGSGFRTASGESVERPDWIVVQESPLVAYSSVPQAVRDVLPHYQLVQTFRAVDMLAPHVYDQQDALFIPLAGFRRVWRPGPNFYVYRRVT